MSKEYIGVGLKSTGPNFNVLNVIRVLLEDAGNVIYMPAQYTRTSKKRVDEKVHHGLRNAPVAMEVQEFISDSNRFNFSVRGLKDVTIEENGQFKNRKVFRTYNIIRDGGLMVNYLEAKLSEESYVQLALAGILYDQRDKQVTTEDSVYNPEYVYTIMLRDMPVVSKNWAQPTQLKFLESLFEEEYLSAKAATLRKIKRELLERYAAEEGQTFNPEDKIYKEKTKATDDVPVDSYEVDCVAYRLKNCDFGIKESCSYEAMRGAYKYLFEVENDLKEVKRRLTNLRFLIRAVTFSIEETKLAGAKTFDFSEPEKLPRSKDKMVQRARVEVHGQSCTLEKIMWKQVVQVY